MLFYIAALSALTALAACGGGGGGGSKPAPVLTPTPAPMPAIAPKSESAADVKAFAKSIGYSYAVGPVVQRYENIYVVNGETRRARFDFIKDKNGEASVGVTQLIRLGQTTIFGIDGQPLVTDKTPNGIYSGNLEMTYRMSPTGDWMATMTNNVNGKMFMDLNMTTGEVSMYGNASNDTHFIRVFGSGAYKDGRITSDGMGKGAALISVSKGMEGVLFKTPGKLDAIVNQNDDKPVILGTISATDPTGFEMNGGLILPYRPEMNGPKL